ALGNRELSSWRRKPETCAFPCVSSAMRPVCFIAFALFAVTLTTAPAWAFTMPETNAVLPTQHQQDQRASDDQATPYAMSYTDEAAQRLGVKDGKWEAFDTRSSNPLV